MDYFLKSLLSNKQTKEAIGEFCASKQKYCRENKEIVCERILRVSGYNTKNFSTTSFCKLYKELNEFSSEIKMSDELLENIRSHASSDLRAFIIFNRYNVSSVPARNFLTKYKGHYISSTVKSPEMENLF